MNINFDDEETTKIEFKQKLRWFEEELDQIFGNKPHNYTQEDVKLANQLLDRLSEILNQYPKEKLMYYLVETLTKIEKKYPGLFKT